MAVFTSVHDLQDAILSHQPDEFFDSFIVGRETRYFDNLKKAFAAEIFEGAFGITPHNDEMVVVGSSKLGFALHEKRKGGNLTARAFRKFDVDSDIDLSICSPQIFSILWKELSTFVNSQRSTPFSSGRLGDYLVYGWLRTDKLPIADPPFLGKCRELADVRAKLRRDRQRGHAKANIGIFYDLDHLRLYQVSSIRKCRAILESPL